MSLSDIELREDATVVRVNAVKGKKNVIELRVDATIVRSNAVKGKKCH